VTEPQLNILDDHAQPVDEQLGPLQRVVMRDLRSRGSLSKADVGAIAHARRGKHAADETCMFCGVEGDGICESLVQRELADWTPEGDIRLRMIVKAAEPPQVEDDVDPFPAGY
jgi:hypothetical protein